MTHRSSRDLQAAVDEHRELRQRLTEEPGYLGSLLRSRARQKGGQILLFVDQFEELFTLVPSRAEREAYLACLRGAADDPAAPLRVTLSMRSDFLDRLAEHRGFFDELARGLIFLQPPARAGLRDALVQPLERTGYSWASDELVEAMLDELDDTSGALPLLQFAAAKLWEGRDGKRRQLTREAYDAMGGVGGALATHADEVLGDLKRTDQEVVRRILERLVTPEETRAIVDVADLQESLAEPPAVVDRLIDYLVGHRLLVVQSRDEDTGPAVELVHESLITSWPTLQRWLDESQEDSAFLAHLHATAKQWDAKGRPEGLLWRGDAIREARRWHRRWRRPLPALDQSYLQAAFALADRARRRRRLAALGGVAVLLALLAAAAVALVVISSAKGEATAQRDNAQREARRARAAEQRITQQLEELRRKEREKRAAEQKATKATERAETGEKKLEKTTRKLSMSREQLQEALREARAARVRAEAESQRAEQNARTARESAAKVRKLAEAEKKARLKLERLLKVERARVRRLRKQRRKIATELR